MYKHEDALSVVPANGSLSDRLEGIHRFVRQAAPIIDRIAVALHDEKRTR